MKTHALYAGSFDPITCGHMDIIKKAAMTFDKVTVAVGINPKKTRLFSQEEAMELIDLSIAESIVPSNRPTAGFYIGSITDYANEIGATHLVRGLRQISDFNDEFSFHGVVERVDPALTMVHFICDAAYLHVSSSTARELASLGAKLDWLVGPAVEERLRAKYAK
jgi:pantetheine-phosphate adenylyltransferase